MAIVSLNKAVKRTGKTRYMIDKDLNDGTLKGTRNEKNEWQIDTDDLYALYPEIDAQKIKRLENELKESKNTILAIEEKLKNEISKCQELELSIEESNKNKATEIKKVKIDFYYENDPKNVFLHEHIHKFINAVEPFRLTNDSCKYLSICTRILANYVSTFEKFKKNKKIYEDDCKMFPFKQNDYLDKLHSEFVYSITNEDVLKFITEEKIPDSYLQSGQGNIWILQNFTLR